MKKWINRLLFKFGFVRKTDLVYLRFGEDINWTNDDIANLRGFLGTESGRKLISVLNKVVASNNEWAIKYNKGKDFANASGYAQGFLSCVEYIHTISAFKKISENDKEQVPESLLERLRT